MFDIYWTCLEILLSFALLAFFFTWRAIDFYFPTGLHFLSCPSDQNEVYKPLGMQHNVSVTEANCEQFLLCFDNLGFRVYVTGTSNCYFKSSGMQFETYIYIHHAYGTNSITLSSNYALHLMVVL